MNTKIASSYQAHLALDDATKERVVAVMMMGNNREQSIGFFRMALGLHYLSFVMQEGSIDFKAVDKAYNRFIVDKIGKGHSIASILQYMSSHKAVWVLDSRGFLPTFMNYWDMPMDRIAMLLTINLSVAKKLSKLPTDGLLRDWLLRHARTDMGAAV